MILSGDSAKPYLALNYVYYYHNCRTNQKHSPCAYVCVICHDTVLLGVMRGGQTSSSTIASVINVDRLE